MLQAGDIFATKGTGFFGWLARNLMSPETDRFHFGVVKQKIHYEDPIDGETTDDWEIIESIGKGVAIGRLSFYDGVDIKFYRINCSAEKRELMPVMLTALGRAKYDYLLFIKIALEGFWLIFKHLFTEGRFRRIRYDEIRWAQDAEFVCTELVDKGSDLIDESLVAEEITSTPSAIIQAEIEGRMNEVSYL
jgi:hypothetical protein